MIDTTVFSNIFIGGRYEAFVPNCCSYPIKSTLRFSTGN